MGGGFIGLEGWLVLLHTYREITLLANVSDSFRDHRVISNN